MIIHKSKYFYIFVCILLIGCVCFVCLLFNRYILNTADTMSLTYSHSVSTFPSLNGKFYIKDDILYFINEHDSANIIRCIENNWIRTFAKLPGPCEQFVILDNKAVIVQIKDWLYLLNTVDGKLMKLWQGKCVGEYENQVYFIVDTTLYVAETEKLEPHMVLSFDELLASYHDGIVYRDGDGIYQLLLEQLDEPKLLTIGDIAWANDDSVWLIGYKYLYTPNYALRISSYALDMYVYKTGEIHRIYEVDTDTVMDGVVLMAVTAQDNELYVSRQYTDLKFWHLENEEINGTYKYCIKEDVWTKISTKTYSVLAQFDEHFLYGINTLSFFGGIKQFVVD